MTLPTVPVTTGLNCNNFILIAYIISLQVIQVFVFSSKPSQLEFTVKADESNRIREYVQCKYTE